MSFKKTLIVISILILNCCYAQIKFEKGYFIDDSGKKTECLIKNMDWNYNPTSFEYKLSENNIEKKQNNIRYIKEFGIYNNSKFTRYTVQIDRSSEDLSKLRSTKEPKFTTETLFLKTLVEGNVNLYLFNDSNTKRFFYGKPDENPQQLIYIMYNVLDENKIGYNVFYKDQIKDNLNCSTISKFDIDKLQYKENSLTSIFDKYNKCYNPSFVSNVKKEMTANFSLRPRASFSSLSTNFADKFRADFDNKSTFGIGIEAEVLMPFNKKKWSIIVEPQYQYYKAEKSFEADFVSGNYVKAKADYKSIDLPIGIRHYFFLNDKSKFFINALYSFNFSINSSLVYERNDGSKLYDLKMKSRGNFAIGAGYKYDKFSLEARFNTKREVLSDYSYWQSSFNSTSLILGYTLF